MTFFSNSRTIGKVNAQMFGGNSIHNANLNAETGAIYENFEYAARELGVTHFRIPGGQAENFFAEGLIVDGDINPALREALTTIRDAFPGVTVSVVVPTDRSYTGAADMERLAAIVARDFPGQVAAYEIGNEYWGEDFGDADHRDAWYGARASEIAEALERGLGAATDGTDVLIQTANPNGHGSAYNWKKKDGPGAGMGAEERWEAANTAIAEQLSDAAIEAIDGIVHHFYWTTFDAVDPTRSGDFRLPWHDQVWEANLGKELDLHLTEWNVAAGNYAIQGLAAGGAILTMFAQMIEAGVDAAQVWPLQHNTRNDLAGGNRRDVIVDEATGLVVSSVSGAVFDMLAQNTVDLELMAREVDGLVSETATDGGFTAQLFEGEDIMVSYVTSTHLTVERLDIDPALAIPGAGVGVTIVGMDLSTSDGQRSNGAGVADALTVDGAAYHYNEDDVRASIRTAEFTAEEIAAGASIELRPFEIVQIVSGPVPSTPTTPSQPDAPVTPADPREPITVSDPEAPEGPAFVLDDAATLLTPDAAPSAELDGMVARDGHGLIAIEVDTLLGTPDPEKLTGTHSAEDLIGGAGDDRLYGRGGDDRLEGGSGEDRVSGGGGDDIVAGGGQDDVLSGGSGADRFVFRSGDAGATDTILDFEVGQDLIVWEDVSREELAALDTFYSEEHGAVALRALDAEGDAQTILFDGHSDAALIADAANHLFLG